MPKDIRRIVFLGDSLTEGPDLDPSEAYPALIQEKLDAAGIPYRAVNAGISGNTAEDGLRRCRGVLDQSTAVLLVAFGANDLPLGFSAEDAERSLQSIIDRAAAVSPGVQLIIAGVDLPQHQALPQYRAYREMYPRLAAKNHAVLLPNLLDGVAGRPELNLPDGLHPNAAGHRIMAERIWEKLRPLVADMKGTWLQFDTEIQAFQRRLKD